MTVTEGIRTAAATFLDALPEPHHAAATAAFDDEAARRSWTYLPGERIGVRAADLDRSGAAALAGLVESTLSLHAQAQLATIRGLEDVLGRLERGSGRGRTDRRHVGDYWAVVFGDPNDGPVTWRLGGHHVTVGATVIGTEARATPLFLGANPARVEHAGTVVTRPLPREELLAYDLLASLSGTARQAAVLGGDDAVPDDIRSGDDPRVPDDLEPTGVALGELDDRARELAVELIGTYLDRVRPELRTIYDAVVADAAVDATRFAWCGSPRDGAPHYYRLHGPRVLLELDNVQDGANHVHTVWRDPVSDFGDDLLAAHRRAAH